jgi:hypothetical protein
MKGEILIRFVTSDRHEPFGHRTGIFQIAYELRREKGLSEPEHEELSLVLDWFGEHLPKPRRLTASRHPRAEETALSWLKASAEEHMARLRRLTKLIEANGIPVVELRTIRPGYIVYEDEHQVVAFPFADTPR